MEEGAVRIRSLTRRPIDQAAIRAIERREPVRAGGHVDKGAKVSIGDASLSRDCAFLVYRQPFDLPGRQIKIRVEEWHSTHRLAQSADPALAATEMHDVRVFVREHQLQPIVRVADEAARRRRRRSNFNSVVRERRRPSVRQIALVDEDHLDAAARRTKSLVERRGDGLSQRCQATRLRLFALMKVNIEARCGDRPEAQARIVSSRRGSEDRRQAPEQNNQDQRAPRHASRRRHLRADAAPALPPATPCPARERSLRNVKSAMGERRTPVISGWNTATFVLYHRLT